MPRSKEFDEIEILSRATTLFWKKGFHDTSIKDLIGFLGISNASIYNTFGGKRQLFGRALQHYQTQHLEGMRNFLASQDDVRSGIRSIFLTITSEDENDKDCKGCFVVNTTTELIPADPEIKKVLANHQSNIERYFLEFLQKGVNSGQISSTKDIKTIARLMYTVLTGLRVLGKSKPNTQESMASVDAVLSLLD